MRTICYVVIKEINNKKKMVHLYQETGCQNQLSSKAGSWYCSAGSQDYEVGEDGVLLILNERGKVLVHHGGKVFQDRHSGGFSKTEMGYGREGMRILQLD